jgi:hypothetical protein
VGKIEFRDLRADEIEVRVSTVNAKGCTLLLYKDARCDMNILDETVGACDWQREHLRDNANCKVSIWDEKKQQWIAKEDTGTESFTEKEKGLASDSFKRACFNWGIGRELYTAPFIWVAAANVKLEQKNGKHTTYDRFKVTEIEIQNKKIVGLTIVNERTGAICFSYGNMRNHKQTPAVPQQPNPNDTMPMTANEAMMLQLRNAEKTDREILIYLLKQNNINSTQFTARNSLKGASKEHITSVLEAFVKQDDSQLESLRNELGCAK